MADNKFILVETSPYVPLNPDHSAQSVPINAHFEITIRKSPAQQAEKLPGEKMAKPAPVVILSSLAKGAYPLFGSANEVSAFAASLIIKDSNWSKNYTSGSDELRFTYNGGARTLSEDFEITIYSDAFNSTAENKKRADIHVESKSFSQQFDGSFDDSYEITLQQAYAPSIPSFAPAGLTPVEEGKPEYSAKFGEEVLLSWVISGDSLKSPTLTENDGVPQTVSFDTPVKCVICSPTVFRLTVESNAYTGVRNSRMVSFGISTPPSITLFQAAQGFCLPGGEEELKMEISAALNCTITAQNSTEGSRDLPVSSKTVTVRPVLKEEKHRLVEYTLTASGSKAKETAVATASASVFVSRWKKAEKKPASVLRHSEKDSVVRTFRFLNKDYCFSGQALWQSGDKTEWKQLSELILPKGAIACKTAYGFYDAECFIVASTKDSALYLARYNLVTNTWAETVFFGPDLTKAGGAFACVSEERLYYFAPHDNKIACYNYSPDPFDCWGQIGWLEVPAKAVDVDSLFLNQNVYIAVACADSHTYLYRMSCDLETTDSPVVAEADSAWIRLLEINGKGYAAAQTGLFDVETGIKTDMIFDSQPKLLGLAGGTLLGISADDDVWVYFI